MTVRDIGSVDQAINAAWDHPGPAVIDFHVEREANVFPIVPQGKSIGEMMVSA
jgi:acetolactate synthase-1/2/3 large subunit